MPSIPTKACTQLARKVRSSVGNHRREKCRSSKGFSISKYYYHWTPICVVNEDTEEYYTDNGGYNTVSTNWAIRSYEVLFPYHKKITKEQAEEEWGAF